MYWYMYHDCNFIFKFTSCPCRDTHEPEGVATCSWDASAITGDDPEFAGLGEKDTGHDFHAAPDLDHTNEMVQAGLSDFTRCACDPLWCG
jgi:hypothetical protein